MSESLDARAKKVFDEIIDLERAERSAALDRLCPGDAELRARVQTLLAAGEKDDTFLSDLAPGPASSAGARAAVGGVGVERPGTRIGPYKLLELIGEGGFGSVFMAEQVEPVRRRVALKIVKLGMDTRAVVARFEQERQALALMDHPNIAKVFDAGATETGRPYFVMELVKGEPITAYCDAANLSIAERLELFTQVCRAVQHAHIKGVIHRDIKPANVLVSTQDGRAFCKVIDFGIAKAIQRPLTDKTIFTEFRQFIGTPEYMSPEQAAGGLDLDTRTDVYSLGVLLYELLAGVTPFDSRQLRSAAYGEIQRIIREVDPPAPSTRLSQLRGTLASVAAMRRVEPRKLGPIIRGDLDWIVMRALDKDRTRRYDSPGTLAADVERYLTGQAVEAAPPSPAYRLRKTVARHRVGVTSAGLVAAALILGLGLALWQATVAARERDAQKLAAAAALAAKEESDKRGRETEQVAAFEQSQLSGIDLEMMGKRLRHDLLTEARAGMERSGMAPEKIAQRQEQLTQLLGDVNPAGVALKSLDENIFVRALNAADKQFKDQPLLKARLLQTLADTLGDLGLFERAAAPQAEALAIRRRFLGGDAPDTLVSLNHLSVMLLNQGKFAQAEEYCREVLRSSARVFGPDHAESLGALGNMGMALQGQGKQREAEPFLRDMLSGSRRVYGPDDPNTLQAMNNMGGVLMDQNKPADAEPYFRESLERRRKIQGPDAPDAVLTLSNLALSLEKQDRPKDAEPLYREALERSRRLLGEDHFQTLLFKSNLGFLLCTLGDLTNAELLTSEALAVRRRTLGESSQDTLQSIHNMGVLRLAQDRPADAETLFREALAGREREFGPDSPPAGATRTKLAQAMARQTHHAQAEAMLLEAERRVQAADAPEGSGAYTRIVKDLAGLYDSWNTAQPGQGHDTQAAKWREKLPPPVPPASADHPAGGS